MSSFRARRLAAVDMHGIAGTRLRRRIIIAEFVFGALAGLGLGALVLSAADTWTSWLFGAWVVGIGVNYLILTGHVLSLRRPGVLAEELAGVDVRAELARYTRTQFWVLLPLSLVAFGLRDTAAARRPD